MTPPSSFMPSFVTVWLFAQLSNVTHGSLHEQHVSSIDIDVRPEEQNMTWPEEGYPSRYMFPEDTWGILFFALPKCNNASKEEKDYNYTCESQKPAKDGCHSTESAASALVGPANCTIRMFQDAECTNLVHDPNAEYGPTYVPFSSLYDNARRCVHLGRRRSEKVKAWFTVTCPEASSLNNEGLPENADTLLSQERAAIEDEDIVDQQIDLDNGATDDEHHSEHLESSSRLTEPETLMESEVDHAEDADTLKPKGSADIEMEDVANRQIHKNGSAGTTELVARHISQPHGWSFFRCDQEKEKRSWILYFSRKSRCGGIDMPDGYYTSERYDWRSFSCHPWNAPMHNRVVTAHVCECVIELFKDSECKKHIDTEAAKVGPAPPGRNDVGVFCADLWPPGDPVNGSFRITCPE